ncbi:hypothetical protein ACHAWT_003603 [Skeletonema menzelii]
MVGLHWRKTISTIVLLFYVVTISLVSSSAQEQFSLEDFQRVLRSSLDSELDKITGAKVSTAQETASIHAKSRTLMRRRASVQNRELEGKTRALFDWSSGHVHTSEDIWNDILQHTWKIADTIKRGEGKSVPFLVCGEHLDFNDIVASFNKLEEEAMIVSSSHNEVCLVLSTTSVQGREVTDSFGGSLIGVPLPDITKIHSGTIDEVLSKGWSVPFSQEQAPKKSNATEMINHWERIIIVDFTPELGGMKEESDLLEVVNIITNDIQDMGEVGWYHQMDIKEKQKYSLDEGTIDIPSLSDVFSLTSIENSTSDNQRIRFWREVFKKGIESKHVCNTMFSTLFVKARNGNYSFELVLNPMDGPSSQEYESSASNSNCVASLIAALSVHPYVLSVKANFPTYHGWNVAQLMDSN